jgi:integrase
MAVGDHIQRRDHIHARAGTPISPRTKSHVLMATRMFFRDCQEWEWIPRRFDPTRALALPRTVNALIGTSPRVITDEVWAKLMWAGLNLEPGDLPGNTAGTYYPMELIRAVTLTWLFSGLRSDEISRLRTGCIRWQHDGQPTTGDAADVLAGDAVCLLDVPVHKTGTAFTKPVDPIVGQAIETWQARRPGQPSRLDRKTGEHVDLLFCVRAQPVAKDYINQTIIPALCAKAGVPTTDVRGKITSHRARSTIASQLYNAKEPMTLFELQAWLGHRDPSTTQHYAKITPHTLTRAYTQAGTSPATSEPSRCCSTATPSPPGPPPPASPGSTTTSATATAPTPSSSNARTGWPAHAATSTPPRAPARPSYSRPKTTCNTCSPRSRSPTTSAPPSRTGKPPSTPSSPGSPMSPPRQGPPHGRPVSCHL